MRDGEPLFANRTLLDLAGYADLEDFRARDGVKAIFRGRDAARRSRPAARSSASRWWRRAIAC